MVAVGLGEGREAALEIEFPIRVIAFDGLALNEITGIDGAIHDEWAADGGIAVEADAVEADDERIPRNSAFYIKRSGQGISARGSAYAFRVCSSRVYGPGFYGIAGIDTEGRLDRVGEKMMELGGLEIVSFGDGRFRRLPGRFPCEIDLALPNGAFALEAAVSHGALKHDRGLRIGLHDAFDASIPKRALKGVVAEFPGQMGSIELQLKVIVIRIIEVLDDRDPFARGRCLAEGRTGEDQKGYSGAHARYDTAENDSWLNTVSSTPCAAGRSIRSTESARRCKRG